jgi:predicted transcriptional regulator
MEHLHVHDILRDNSYPSVRITVTMDELLDSAMNQNFIPVVDDTGNFIGIVTRKDNIRYFAERKDEKLRKAAHSKENEG